jgi:putative endonuclease
MKRFFVYIMASPSRVLYTGVTSNLPARVYQHRMELADGFTKRYGVKQLVYFEPAETAYAAISREKQIKSMRRAKKIRLIEAMNPRWVDFGEGLVGRG